MQASVDIAIYSALRDILSFFGDTFNKIGAFVVGTIAGIKSTFDVLPEFIGDIAKSAANLFVDGMELLANGAIYAVNKVIDSFNTMITFLGADKAAEYFGFSVTLDPIAEADLSGHKMTLTGQGKKLSEAFSSGLLQLVV